MENWVNLVRSVSIPTKDNAGRSMIRPQQLSSHDFSRTNFIYGNTPLIYLGLVLKPESPLKSQPLLCAKERSLY